MRDKMKNSKKKNVLLPIVIVSLLLLIILVVVLIVYQGVNEKREKKAESEKQEQLAKEEEEKEAQEAMAQAALEEEQKKKEQEKKREQALEDAKRLAASYDYDQAVELLKTVENYSTDAECTAAIAEYEEEKSKCVRYEAVDTITHVFFHILIADKERAFDGDYMTANYNQVMTTIPEFEKILEQMYERGYVLVGLHDMAYIEKDADGNEVMKEGDIYLPEGKIPFVMSQDDVCYYEYMDGDGYATRLVIDEDGKPKCEYTDADGNTTIGDYDLIPILDSFIEEHPDFSYRGAKAVIAVTGYNGVFGYRTDDEYKDTNPNFEQDKEEVKKIAQVLRDQGWELASHSWGHLGLGSVEYDRFKTDTDKWESRVESLIGDTDIILYPFGDDIGTWYPYEGKRYKYLYKQGFRYFCTVDSAQYWVQITDKYLRQGRRNLDGQRMYQALCGDDRLSDLFSVKDVFDQDRPTPVE